MYTKKIEYLSNLQPILYVSSCYEVTSSNFQITNQKSERVLIDTILQALINYDFLETYLINIAIMKILKISEQSKDIFTVK